MAIKLGATGITFHDNSVQTTAATGGGVYQAVIYATSTTWTAPAGVTRVKVIVVGGGGGGLQSGDESGSGGYGGCGWNYYTVTPGTGYAVTVGAGGAAASAGGSSSFSSFITSTGGAGAPGNGNNGASGTCANSFGVSAASPENLIIISSITGGAIGKSVATNVQTWVRTQPFSPGAAGDYNNGSNSGVGGVVYIEYLG